MWTVELSSPVLLSQKFCEREKTEEGMGCLVVFVLLNVVAGFTSSLQWLPTRLFGVKNRSKYDSIRVLHGNIGDDDYRHDDQLRNLFDAATRLAVPGDTKETLINLINYGDNWIKQYNNTDSNWTYRYSFAQLFVYTHSCLLTCSLVIGRKLLVVWLTFVLKLPLTVFKAIMN